MELKPGIGLDKLIFGASEADVMTLIGDPDITFDDEDDNNELIYQYNALKLRLSFYRNQERKLAYIRCGNNNITHNGQPLINRPVKEVTEQTLQKYGSWQTDCYQFFDIYFNEQNNITLNVEYEEVADLELGVTTNKDGSVNWPA